METLHKRRTSGAASSDFFKGCLHDTRNEIDPSRNLNRRTPKVNSHHKRNPIYITFNCADDPRKTARSAKTNHSCFDEINTCADVSFRMI